MKGLYSAIFISLCLLFFSPLIIHAEAIQPAGDEPINEEALYNEDFDVEEALPSIPDPLEPLNRAVFYFNDRMYFWVLKPAAQGYNKIMPEKARVGIRRFFLNIGTPVRFVNSLLQFKLRPAGIELSRFFINTTIGVLGFMDPARERWNLFIQKEDSGQTLGFFGAGTGFYLVLPFIGPSSLRDAIGMVGDFSLDPTIYLLSRSEVVLSYAYWQINEVSLEIGTYESIKKDAFDPYVSIRNMYHQHRESRIKE